MHRLTVRFAVATAAFGLLLVPAGAQAAGCEVVRDARDRAECRTRAVARDAARAEVQRELGTDGAGARGSGVARSAEWRAAVEEADGIDAGALLEPRPLAAIGGIAWFLVVLRSRMRVRARTRASRPSA